MNILWHTVPMHLVVHRFVEGCCFNGVGVVAARRRRVARRPRPLPGRPGRSGAARAGAAALG